MMGTNLSTDTDRCDVSQERTSRDTVADLMPWLATVLLHFAAVLIAVLYVWARLDKPPVDENIIPIISCPSQNKPLQFRDFRKQVKVKPAGGPLSPTAMPVANPAEASLTKSPLAFGLNGGPSVVKGPFASSPSGVGAGTIFNVPDAPDSGTTARSIVFVIDASGSMVDTLPFVMAELKRAVRTLSDQHRFAVLFYQNDTVVHAMRPGMHPAIESNKQALFDWLDGDALTPSGLSSPVKAIEQGLLYKPQVMFLLSDNITGSGRYELHQGELLLRVKRANLASTKISTIQFLHPDPLTRIPGMKPTLERISEQSGGVYKYLSARELGL